MWSYIAYPPNSSSEPSPVSTTLIPRSATRLNRGTETTALMMSPYSVSSEILIASLIWASRMIPGGISMTSCRTPRSAVSLRA